MRLYEGLPGTKFAHTGLSEGAFWNGDYPLLHVLQYVAQHAAEERLVVVARVGRHLAEELCLCLSPFGELRTLVAFGRHAADAEARAPGLLAHFESRSVNVAAPPFAASLLVSSLILHIIAI